MRRIYSRAKIAVAEIDLEGQIVALVGFLTFFFGFAAGAILNLYLIAINHPLVHQFRSALTYKSAIFGDGILLPILNMIAAAFILKNWDEVSIRMRQIALGMGLIVTIYFHINQAMEGIVNWAMPKPWHWNILGVWHMLYMLFVASLLSLFYLTVIKYVKEEREMPVAAIIVTGGIFFFFVLLRLDYIAIDLSSFMPKV